MIHHTAIVETKKIGNNVTIMPYSIIHENVIIGNDVIIHPNVVIESGVEIGDKVEIFPGSYMGKEPKGAGTLSRIPKFKKKVVIGNECSIGPHAIIYYDVIIGNNTLIGDGASIREQSTVGKRCIIARYVTLNYNAHVGDRTKIMDMTHITGNCFIGNDVFIGMLVCTANDNSIGSHTYDELKERGPTIKNFAKVGMGVSILPAVEIGENSFIGANSLVTKNVPSNKIVRGIPARVINIKQKS